MGCDRYPPHLSEQLIPEVGQPLIPEVGQPIGWNPTSQKKMGDGKWCAVGVPAKNWHLRDYCGAYQDTHVERFLSKSDVGSRALPSSRTTSRIKVLTYNLYWWNLFKNQKGLNGKAGKNIAAFAKDEPFDLMGFQECEDVSWPLRDAKAAGVTDDYTTIAWAVSPFNIAVAIRTSVFDIKAQGKWR